MKLPRGTLRPGVGGGMSHPTHIGCLPCLPRSPCLPFHRFYSIIPKPRPTPVPRLAAPGNCFQYHSIFSRSMRISFSRLDFFRLGIGYRCELSE